MFAKDIDDTQQDFTIKNLTWKERNDSGASNGAWLMAWVQRMNLIDQTMWILVSPRDLHVVLPALKDWAKTNAHLNM